MTAPSPWAARATISWVGSWARPLAAEAAVKTAMPRANTLRGPKTSPRRADVINSTAYRSEYAFSTQSTWSRLACSPSRMLGIAMLTMVRSSSVMKRPRTSTLMTGQGLMRTEAWFTVETPLLVMAELGPAILALEAVAPGESRALGF